MGDKHGNGTKFDGSTLEGMGVAPGVSRLL